MRVISVKYLWLRNGLVNCQDVTCSLLLFALLCLQCLLISPKNPNDEPSKSASNSLLPKILQTSPNSSQSPSKNPPKTLPKPSQIEGKLHCSHENDETALKTALGQCPPPSWMPFWVPKASQERPKSFPKAAKI